jgi:hypothetical protein
MYVVLVLLRARLGRADRYSKPIAKPTVPTAAASSSDGDGTPTSGRRPSRSPKNMEDEMKLGATGRNKYDMLHEEDEDYDSTPAAASTTPAINGVSSSASSRQPPTYNEAHAIDRIKSLAREYFASNDLKEAVLCVDELPKQCPREHIVYHTLSLSYELKDFDRTQANQLCIKLYDAQKLTSKDFELAMDHLLRNADDASIDLPAIPTYIGQSFASFVQHQILPITYLSSSTTREVNAFDREKIAISTLLGLQKQFGEDALIKALQNKKWDLTSLINTQRHDVGKLLAEKRLTSVLEYVL